MLALKILNGFLAILALAGALFDRDAPNRVGNAFLTVVFILNILSI